MRQLALGKYRWQFLAITMRGKCSLSSDAVKVVAAGISVTGCMSGLSNNLSRGHSPVECFLPREKDYRLELMANGERKA